MKYREIQRYKAAALVYLMSRGASEKAYLNKCGNRLKEKYGLTTMDLKAIVEDATYELALKTYRYRTEF